MLVNAAAPKEALGAVNGAGQSLASAVRAAGPALGGLAWGWSVGLAGAAWWPSWLPHQYAPFLVSALMAAGTDIVYHGMQMPGAESAGGGGGGHNTKPRGRAGGGSGGDQA